MSHIELELAYRKAEYWILSTPSVLFKIENPYTSENAKLLAMIKESAFIITAHNPGSHLLSPAQNQELDRDLRKDIRREKWNVLPTKCQDPQKRWPDETGYLVLDATENHIVELGLRYRQNAIVKLTRQGPAALLWLPNR